MKIPKLATASGTLCLATLAAVASPCVMAADHVGWYGGANVGSSKADIDDEEITRSQSGAGFTTTDDDYSDLGYKLFGGYQFSRHFAMEAGYFDLGEFDYTATSGAGSLSSNMQFKGVNLDFIGIAPITERFSAFGRLGANYAESKTAYSSTGAVATPSSEKERDWNPKIGLGLQYDLTPSWAMRAEVERYRINDAVGNDGDIDLASLGLIYRFGVMAPAPAPAPYVAAPEPAPRPVAVIPPPPPPPTKVAFSADALFDFDKAVLKPSGKQAIDTFAADLRNTDYDVIRVTGHTDRLGSHNYNLALSQRRAEAVRDYLVESAGISPGKIETRGVDGAEPVTKPGECQGENRTRELIACLQPDRRVEVEVTGTAPR